MPEKLTVQDRSNVGHSDETLSSQPKPGLLQDYIQAISP
jgi:hypothetical protein